MCTADTNPLRKIFERSIVMESCQMDSTAAALPPRGKSSEKPQLIACSVAFSKEQPASA